MKIKLFFLLFLYSSVFLVAQQQEERSGLVSYKSSQNVYIKFESTEGILTGDTLYIKKTNRLEPAILIKFISSKSAAGEILNGNNLEVDDIVIALVEIKSSPVPEVLTKPVPDTTIAEKKDSLAEEIPVRIKTERKNFSGRLSVQSYSGFNNFNSRGDMQRWRYSFLFKADKIAESDFSFTNYIIFTYKTSDWQNVSDDLFNALKIYDLAVKYNLSENDEIWFGRHLNRRISNIGPIDGFQYEKKFDQYYTGIILGSRPDYRDLSFNLKLFEYGGFIGRTDSVGENYLENTFGIIQQTNNSIADRRFIYYQHSNDLMLKTNFFFSTEIDLFQREKGKAQNTFSFTSLFLSARYSPERWLSMNLSYDALKNVIYSETFKNFTDSLIENETRQGLRFGVNVRPFSNFYVGFNSGYRYRKGDLKPSRNFNIYSAFSRIPVLEISSNINLTYLINSFIEGNIFGISFSKDLPFNNSNISFTYRRSDYSFPFSSSSILQNNILVDFTSKLFQNIYFSISWDGTFEKERSHGRILLDLTTRF